MKKLKMIFYLFVLFLGLIIIYKYYNDSDYVYYKKKKYLNKDSEFVLNQTIQRRFLIDYKLSNYDVLDLNEMLEYIGWDKTKLNRLIEDGVYITQYNDEILVYSNGYNKERDDRTIDLDNLSVKEYFIGTDILILKTPFVYDICKLSPWEFRWFKDNNIFEYKELETNIKSLINEMLMSFDSISQDDFTEALFHGILDSDRQFKVECICQRDIAHPEIVEKTIEILQENLNNLTFDEFYIPLKLPKSNE